MGRREKKVKSLSDLKEEEEEDKELRPSSIAGAGVDDDDDDVEANEDLSLKIVEKAMLRACRNSFYEESEDAEVITNLKEEVSNVDSSIKEKKKKEKKKKKIKKSRKTEEEEVNEASEIDPGFKSFCGELFTVDPGKEEQKVDSIKATENDGEVNGTDPVEAADNVVLRKLLRGPRYFDPPDSSWGRCYNCGEEGHTTVNCTSAKRRRPCFVCGSLEHNARNCSKSRDCFICKKGGHRAKDCPEKNSRGFQMDKLCLKCGDTGHDMFSCRSNYCSDDLKEIQCYMCQSFGHLCCVNYSDPGPREISCYKCGLLGHTGLACSGYRGETSGTPSLSSCYRCGEGGHFARECTNSSKSGKRNRELSTPKKRFSHEDRDHLDAWSAPNDLGKAQKKKKKIKHEREYLSASKSKRRGGWITEDPGDLLDYNPRTNGWRSPVTPSTKSNRHRTFNSSGGYASSSYASNRSHKLNFSNSASNGTAKSYQHRYSASRFGSYSNDGMRRNYNW